MMPAAIYTRYMHSLSLLVMTLVATVQHNALTTGLSVFNLRQQNTHQGEPERCECPTSLVNVGASKPCCMTTLRRVLNVNCRQLPAVEQSQHSLALARPCGCSMVCQGTCKQTHHTLFRYHHAGHAVWIASMQQIIEVSKHIAGPYGSCDVCCRLQ